MALSEVTTEPATGITPTKATLHGTVNPNGLPTTYWFEYFRDDWQAAGLPSRTNLVTNPGFEVDLTGWEDDGSMATPRSRTEKEAHTGTASQKIVADSFGDGAKTALLDVPSASQSYTVTVYVKAPEGTANILVQLGEWTGGGSLVGNASNSDAPTGDWQAITVTRAFGATGTKAQIRVRSIDATTFYFDSVLLEQAAESLDFFPRPHELESGQAVENEDGTYTMATPTYAPASKEGDAGEGSEAAAVSGQITGLEPSTEYHFRLVAVNAEGEVTGENAEFETLAAPKIFDRDKPDLALDVEIETPEGFFRLSADDEDPTKRPEDIQFSTQRGDGFGPASCKLSRSVFKEWDDIEALDTWRFVGREADVDVAYEGRLHSTPRSTDPKQEFSISLVGWMTYLTGREMPLLGIDSRLGSWEDPSLARRAYRVAAEVRYTVNKDVGWRITSSGNPGIFFDYTDLQTSGKTDAGEAWFDAKDQDIGKLLYHFTRLNGTELQSYYNTSVFLATSDTLSLEGEYDSGEDHNGTTNANEYEVLNASDAGRTFAVIKDEREGVDEGATLQTLDSWEYPKVIGTHELPLYGEWPEVGFRMSDLIQHILETYYPKIEWAGDENDFVVQQATWHDEPKTGYAAIQQLNDLALWETNVWEERKFYFRRADLTDFDWQIRTDDPGVTVVFQGESIENFANGVAVTYTDFSGRSHTLYPDEYAELRDDGADNPANTHDENLWTSYTVPFQCSLSEALKFGEIYLEEYNRPKRPGTFRVGGGYIKDKAGHWQQGWKVRSSQTLSVMNLIDDEPRLIFATTWNQDSKELEITVDATPKRIDAMVGQIENVRQARNL